jgi:hypothetical protein
MAHQQSPPAAFYGRKKFPEAPADDTADSGSSNSGRSRFEILTIRSIFPVAVSDLLYFVGPGETSRSDRNLVAVI